MILIIHTERSHIAAFFIGLAIFFTLAGWSYTRYQQSSEIADAVRDWREVNILEARLNRHQQVLDFYTRVKPIPVPQELALKE